MRTCVLGLLLLVVLCAPARADELVGSIHGHTAYSDGYVGSRPANAYANARGHGNDFYALTDHSDTLDLPISVSEECLTLPQPDGCAVADQVNPADSFRKWAATEEQMLAASTPSFTGIRGFEWTSDRFGHINVLFSRNQVNAKLDGGYGLMETFYSWLARPMGIGGGSDGLAVFNHPGAKSLSEDDPGYNWNDFAYDPAVDRQMVGIEVFNDGSEFGAFYPRALDAGWHVGAVGAEDLGHRRGDDWGGPAWPKTVVLAPDRSRESLKAAMLARRFYAVRRPAYRLSFTVDGAAMGSRIVRPDGASVAVRGAASGPEALELDLVTSGGEVVATGGQTLEVEHAPAAGEEWFFLRARRAGTQEAVAFSSPVWVERGSAAGSWLAGDLHVHSCFSHDVYCGPGDEPLAYEPEETAEDLAEGLEDAQLLAENVFGGLAENGGQAVTFGLDVGSRFAEASARGLDYLAITDHERVESSADGGFGASGVVGLPAYENSIDGHAQMLGARRVYEKTDARAMRDALHADGGLLQANHPAYKVGDPFTGCDDPGLRHWHYGYDFPPDTIEVYNPTSPIDSAEAYLECWLQRGARISVTGGSDSHWASLAAAGAGAGAPTTFVFSRQRTDRGVLDGIAAGRTTVSKRPPLEGGAPVLLEADADGDGTYEAMMGDTVPAGTPMRVRSESPSVTGFVKVRANGEALVPDAPELPPGGEVTFTAPGEDGWVRAVLLALPESAVGVAPCPGRGQALSTCTYDQLVLALTSPIYLAERGPEPTPTASPGPSATASPGPSPTPAPSPEPSPAPAPTGEDSLLPLPPPLAPTVDPTPANTTRVRLRVRPSRFGRAPMLRVVCDGTGTIRFTVAGRSFAIAADGSGVTFVRVPRRVLRGLAPGRHVITARLVDGAGRPGPAASRSFRIRR